MKICHIVDTLNAGGLERTLIQIVLGLKGFQHQVWCLKDKGMLASELEAEGVVVREFFFEGRVTWNSLRVLKSALKQEGFDIAHCHGLFPSIWGRLAGILAGIGVLIVHCQNVYYGIAWKERLKLRVLGLFTRRIIAVSEAVRTSLVNFVGIAPGRITVIYNSAGAMHVCSDDGKKAIRRELGYTDEDFLIGSIGRLAEHKGHCVLIQALALLRNKYPQCKALIAGEGEYRRNLAAFIRQSALDREARLLGYRKDVGRILCALDVYVQPSVEREGLPLALAEASSAGIALIATDAGGNPEIVRDGYNGFIVAQNDAATLAEKIAFLIGHPEERRKMAMRAHENWAEKFTLEKMLREIEEVYRG